MNEENQISYYAVIPATIRYDIRLKAAEKLMYGEITSLTNRMGDCFANNKYFANLYNVRLSTISRWISNLAKLKYIEVELIRNEKKEIIERRIYVLDNPYMQNCTYPISKKRKDNNINIKIDRLFNYIINNKSEFPEELKGTDLKEIYSVLRKFEMLYTDEIISFYTENNIIKVKYIIYALVDISKTDRKIENTQLDNSQGQDEFWSRTGQNLLKALALGQTELLKNSEERSMSKIYNTLSTGDIKAIDRYFVNIRGPGRMSYNIYAQATDVVKQSVVTGLATRLQIFQTKKVRQTTDKSDIDLRAPRKRKVCVFLCYK